MAHTGVKALAINICETWEDPKLMDAKWVEITESDKQDSPGKLVYAPDRTVLSWKIRDGDLFMFKDSSIPTKELTEEEKKKIKDEEDKRRKLRLAFRNQYQSREESLVIKQKDVGLDDI